jgi:hypothetical protein
MSEAVGHSSVGAADIWPPRHRSVAWAKLDPPGTELAEIVLGPGSLEATGVAIGVAPVTYRLDYRLDASDGLRTRRLEVRARGAGWRRQVVLTRDGSGAWTIDAAAEGEVDLPAPGGDASALAGAEDVDLGLSPLTNSMPVLRHDLLQAGERDFLMAWISVPDLAVHADPQRYTFVRATAGGRRLVRFLGPEQGGFTADIAFDADGLVVDYPFIARRLG